MLVLKRNIVKIIYITAINTLYHTEVMTTVHGENSLDFLSFWSRYVSEDYAGWGIWSIWKFPCKGVFGFLCEDIVPENYNSLSSFQLALHSTMRWGG